ncbi:MAG: MFS transporter, partial [Ornithinibacter sp.]
RPRASRVGVAMSYRLVWRSIRALWGTSRHTVYFLLASALYRDGLAGVFAFGAILAAGTFGMSAGEVIIFGAAANIVAGVATMAFGLLDDRLGPKRVILISLAALVVLGVAIFVLHDGGVGTFWVLGLLMTVFVGPAQAASRSFLARLIPEGKSGEIFGLYATTGRVVSFLSPLAFGGFIAVGAVVTGAENTQYWGILGIVLILAAGFAVMVPVKEHTQHTMS